MKPSGCPSVLVLRVAKWMDGRMDKYLPLLQDLVPYRGRCHASPHENQGESRAGQGNRWPFDAFGLLIWARIHNFRPFWSSLRPQNMRPICISKKQKNCWIIGQENIWMHQIYGKFNRDPKQPKIGKMTNMLNSGPFWSPYKPCMALRGAKTIGKSCWYLVST